MKTNLFNTIIIILVMGMLVCLPHPGKAQYGPFSYPVASWGNPGLFQFPSYAPNFSLGGFAPGYGSLGGINTYAPYSTSWGGYSPYGASYSPYGASLGGYNPYSYYPSYTSSAFPAPPPLPVGNIETVRAMDVKGIYVYYIFEEAYSDGMTIPTPEISLRVADISDPGDPDVVKSIALDYPMSEIFIHGDYLYCFSETNLWDLGYNLGLDEYEYLLCVFDISDPDSPAKRDTLKLKFSSQGPSTFSFHGDRLYILYRDPEEDWDDEILKLVTIDISNPGDLSRLSTGEIDLDDSIISDMTVRDNLAFLSNGYILNISDPGHPSIVSEVEGSHLRRLAVFGNYLLFTVEEEGLWIVDIEDPSHPELITTVELSWPDEIIVKGQRAYISDRCKGLNVVDLTDPENPELLSGYRLPSHKMYRSASGSSEGWLGDMDIGEGLAFTLSFSNIQIWDISEAGDVEMAGMIGSDHARANLMESVIPGEMVLLLSLDAIDLVSLGQDGDIATFGIDSLDALNREFDISKITKETSSHDIPALMSDFAQYSKRTYSIEFPESVDMSDIWDAYMDNPYCLIAEFRYTPAPYSTGVILSPMGGYYGSPFLGAGGYGLGFGAFNPYGYSGIPFQSSNLLQGPYGIPGAGYSPYGLINSFQYGFGIPGLINSSPWTPLSPVFPGGNWQFPNQSYWPGSIYPGANTYNSIYPIYNPYGYQQSYYPTPYFSQGAYIGRIINGQLYPSSLSYDQIYAGGGPTYEQLYFSRPWVN